MLIFVLVEGSRCIWLPYFGEVLITRITCNSCKLRSQGKKKTQFIRHKLNFSSLTLYDTWYLMLNFKLHVTLFLITPIWVMLKLINCLKLWQCDFLYIVFPFVIKTPWHHMSTQHLPHPCTIDSTNWWLLPKLMVILRVEN